MDVNKQNNFIKLSGNNGSVPEIHAVNFELTLFENGYAKFIFSKNGITKKESLNNPSKRFAGLFKTAERLRQNENQEINIGGPLRQISISINQNLKTITVTEDEREAFRFYTECLQLYRAGLVQELAEIF